MHPVAPYMMSGHPPPHTLPDGNPHVDAAATLMAMPTLRVSELEIRRGYPLGVTGRRSDPCACVWDAHEG